LTFVLQNSHNDSANSIGVFDAELISKLPKSVKYICHNGAGYDQIDVKAATERGIQVSHTPGAVDDATATTAMFLILSSLRQYWRAEVNARNGKWKTGLKPASDPEGKTIGIVGMGGIGSVSAGWEALERGIPKSQSDRTEFVIPPRS
jgi:lactate dehydrogenase-like 2-hydroxyacid dehydrogenase